MTKTKKLKGYLDSSRFKVVTYLKTIVDGGATYYNDLMRLGKDEGNQFNQVSLDRILADLVKDNLITDTKIKSVRIIQWIGSLK